MIKQFFVILFALFLFIFVFGMRKDFRMHIVGTRS